MPEITTAELADDALVLDVREQEEWDAGHAPGAVHIPMGDLPARIGELPETDGALPVVCRSGNRSGRVVDYLVQQGYDVANVVGGMKQWSAENKPVVTDGSGAGEVV